MKAIIGIVVGLLLGSTIAPAADKVRVSGGGITPLHSIIWVANQEGLFKKHGLDVEYLTMNSGTLGVQTLLSNESQLLFSTGALAVTANVQGADIAMITGGFNLFAFCGEHSRSWESAWDGSPQTLRPTLPRDVDSLVLQKVTMFAAVNSLHAVFVVSSVL